MRPVFLIGMPGAGKTHWGRTWSRGHGILHVDLDEAIEARAGAPVPVIIGERGEQGFRALESEVLAALIESCRGAAAIISCGGGTPTIERNLQLMLRSGCLVYLEADPELLLRQLRASKVSRPLLRELSEGALQALLEQRRPYYEQAHIIVPVGNASAGTFAEILEACTNRHS